MASGAHVWQWIVEKLGPKRIVKQAQYDRIKEAIEELQRVVVTNVRSPDNTVHVDVTRGEALISAPKDDGGAPGSVSGSFSVVTSVDWDSPILSYSFLTMTFAGGRLTSIATNAAVTIDTATECP